MSDGGPIASFRAVSKSYDGIAEALRGLTLDIAPGEFLSVIGPAGAGKSTALSVLAGLHAPDAGTVWLRGQDITRVPAERRGLGVVFTAPSLFPHLDVAANVAFPLSVRRLGRAECEEKATRMLELFSLAGLAALYPGQLTTEQQQRVALARALAFGPDLVLLDEPLGTLQGPERDALRTDLRRVQRELGVAMLHATRDAADALMLSDRIAVLHKGALRQVAPPRELYEEPADAFVADCTGANNRMRGRVVGIEDDMARVKLQAGPEVEALASVGLRPGDFASARNVWRWPPSAPAKWARTRCRPWCWRARIAATTY